MGEVGEILLHLAVGVIKTAAESSWFASLFSDLQWKLKHLLRKWDGLMCSLQAHISF